MTAYPAPATADTSPREHRPAPLPPVLVPESATKARRRRISAIVTTFNEADTIEACLDSLKWCDEILVVDSHSTDSTREIAGRFDGVRVLCRTYYGAASQKNWAIDHCRYDWILILDTDERVTPELQSEIETLLSAPSPATAYSIRRRNHALGGEVRFSGLQHDRVTRLFRRGDARYPNRRVHADMLTRQTPEVLDSVLEHYMVDTLEEYVERTRRYASWGAAQLWRDGRRKIGLWQALVRPAWRFFRTYVLQLRNTRRHTRSDHVCRARLRNIPQICHRVGLGEPTGRRTHPEPSGLRRGPGDLGVARRIHRTPREATSASTLIRVRFQLLLFEKELGICLAGREVFEGASPFFDEVLDDVAILGELHRPPAEPIPGIGHEAHAAF